MDMGKPPGFPDGKDTVTRDVLLEAFPAHIRIEDGQEIYQTNAEHSWNSARYAAERLECVQLDAAGKFAASVHDMGKMRAESARYQYDAAHGLPVRRGSVNHTFAGVRFILSRYYSEDNELAEILAYAAGAHHGLFDCIDDRRGVSGFGHRIAAEGIGYDECLQNFTKLCCPLEELDQCFTMARREFRQVWGKLEDLLEAEERVGKSTLVCGEFYVGLVTRLLLSAVIEGDRRDTAIFMKAIWRPKTWPKDMRPFWTGRLKYLEEKLDCLPCTTAIDRARRTISDMCAAAARRPGGIYRLCVPTGGGKTLAGLRFALTHAAEHNKRRIILVSPLLSILDQNAEVVRKYLGDDSCILEHHSNVVQPDSSAEELSMLELVADSWDAPVIITTLVQLLSTMFSGKTSSIRRYNALCNSVVVIDEVQSVPLKLLSLFNLTVDFLTAVCDTTFILCSATQPALGAAAYPLVHTPEDIVPYSRDCWDPFKRTRIIDEGNLYLQDIPGYALRKLGTVKSMLVVCNTKAEAKALYEEISKNRCRCFYLSAGMCMAHRKDTLKKLSAALKALRECSLEELKASGEQVVCISTQVIEAGVDISFGAAIRMMAGMDSIIQTAGRVNRNAETDGSAPIYIVRCAEESLFGLEEIRMGRDASLELFDEFENNPAQFDWDVTSDRAIEYYYKRLYSQMDKHEQDFCVKIHDKDTVTLLDLLSNNTKYADGDNPASTEYSLRQAFQTAGKYFQVYDDTVEVLVPYGEGKKLIQEFQEKRELLERDVRYVRQILERAKGYTVSLRCYELKRIDFAAITIGGLTVLPDSWYSQITGYCSPKGEV